MRGLKIREAQIDDIAAVYQLEKRSFGQGCYPACFFRQAYDCWPAGFIVVKYEQELVGYCLMAPSNEKDVAWVLSMTVAHNYRGQGISKVLLGKALAGNHTFQRILLTVDPDNKPAMSLYRSAGFEVVKQEANYFSEGDSRLVMQWKANPNTYE